MFVLIFWIKSGTKEVLDKKNIPESTEIGETLRITYDGKKYKGKVLMYSEDYDYLNEIDVSTDGEIMPPKGKKYKKVIKENVKHMDAAILDNLTENKELEPSTVGVCSSYSTPETFVAVPEDMKSSPPRQCEKTELLHDSPQSVKSDTVQILKRKDPYSPKLRREQIVPLLKQITNILEHEDWETPSTSGGGREKSGKRYSSSTEHHRKPEKKRNDNDEVELEPNSGVYVMKSYLTTEVKKFSNRPSEMVRRLMLYLIGAPKLREMTARGTKSKTGVPTRILAAVKYYVDQFGASFISDAEYVQIINQQIACLRFPKVVKAGKNCTKNSDSDDFEI